MDGLAGRGAEVRWVWVSNPRMTVAVRLDEQGRIVESAPIVRKFIGQPFSNLFRWMNSMGRTVAETL